MAAPIPPSPALTHCPTPRPPRSANASSTAVCYEKPPPRPCREGDDAPALHMLYVGPSLTEGYPPSNAALRRVEADGATLDITDVVTSFGNLSAANAAWALVWEEEYRATALYGLPDVSPASWERLVGRMAPTGSAEWAAFWAVSGKRYDGPSAASCEGGCKTNEIAFLNGSGAAFDR